MNVTDGRFQKRLEKKARKGLRGWPMATIAYYGPDLKRASKVAVSIMPGEDQEATELRRWFSETGDVRRDSTIAEEITAFLESYEVKSVAMTNRIIGCPHEEGVDYEGEWCPRCHFWEGRDRFTGKMLG